MTSAPRVLPYGDRALLVELADVAEVVRWVDAVRAADLDAVGDVVSAARTVLVSARDGASIAQLRDRLGEVDLDGGRTAYEKDLGPVGDSDGAVVEIAVRYDGPDLADVARLTGLSEREVVDAHTGRPWRVAFGGFAPGFGYLVGGDPRLEVPRRGESRTSVPAGSVALADTFSGVYPRSSPGGWQLIGTTDAVMWDLDRDPPALLAPGATVRFVEVRS